MAGPITDAAAARKRIDLRAPLGWCLAAPALAVWPFLSAFPLFEMIEGEPTLGLIVTRSLLLATGFWPVLVLMIGARLAVPGALVPIRSSPGGLALGLYAFGWTCLYLLAFVAV